MKNCPQGRELALVIINDGAEYQRRLINARNTLRSQRIMGWVSFAIRGAAKYEREFEGVKFSDTDILYAATALSDYYAQHLTPKSDMVSDVATKLGAMVLDTKLCPPEPSDPRGLPKID